MGCSSLTSITIPDGITTISGGIFSGCTALERIVIPSSVIEISAGEFNGCCKATIYCEQYTAPEKWYFSEDDVYQIVWGTHFDPSVEDSISSYVQSEPPSLSMVWDEYFKLYGGTTQEFLISNIDNSLCWGAAIYIREEGSSDWIEVCKPKYELVSNFDGKTYKCTVYELGFDENKIYDICAKKIEYGKLISQASNIVQYCPGTIKISGSYVFNDFLNIPPVQNISQTINYTMNIDGTNVSYVSISIADDDGDLMVTGNDGNKGKVFYSSGWNNGVGKTINFESEQEVSIEFYDWFIKNTTKL
jgi:hypothetical protein